MHTNQEKLVGTSEAIDTDHLFVQDALLQPAGSTLACAVDSSRELTVHNEQHHCHHDHHHHDHHDHH